jgi:hypothetical protein
MTAGAPRRVELLTVVTSAAFTTAPAAASHIAAPQTRPRTTECDDMLMNLS